MRNTKLHEIDKSLNNTATKETLRDRIRSAVMKNPVETSIGLTVIALATYDVMKFVFRKLRS